MSDFEYHLDEDAGIVALIGGSAWWWLSDSDGAGTFGNGWRNVLVQYTGGYATIPDDLEQIAIEMVAEAFNNRNTDETIQSESMGSYSYTLAANVDIGDELAERLSQWKVLRP